MMSMLLIVHRYDNVQVLQLAAAGLGPLLNTSIRKSPGKNKFLS